MSSRLVRALLFGIVVLLLIGGGYELLLLERQATAARETSRAFDEQLRNVERAISELRAAQYAYVGAGQGEAFWTARSASLLSFIRTELTRLQKTTSAAQARTDLSSATEALATAEQIDQSIKGYLRNEQRLLASDLVFSDLREADEQLLVRVAKAGFAQRAASDVEIDTARRTQAATAAGAALFALLVLALMAGTSVASARQARQSSDVISTGQDAGENQPASPVDSLPLRDTAAAARSSRIDLQTTAKLCTDFARLRETTELPALLGRAARLLDAPGIILWLEDHASHQLRPALAHGYASQALARIPGLAQDSDNATANAFRNRKLVVVDAEPDGNGAVIVPLQTPDGCVGVMTAEVRGGQERDEDVHALATILAAQLATLVAPQAE